jgi:STE24 endopeptidase
MAVVTATFDPAAATARYLSILTPEAHAKATAYTQGGHWLLLWGAVVAVVVSWIIVRSGLLARIRGKVGLGALGLVSAASRLAP